MHEVYYPRHVFSTNVRFSYCGLTIEFVKMPGPEFASMQEEVNYWRNRCEETERDFEEFQQNSHMLEKELELSLEQAEKANRDLKTRNNHLVLENETLKVS